MKNPLDENFNSKTLFKFSLPSIAMMFFMSLNQTIDGGIVSRLVSSDALSAINIVFPAYSVIVALSIMLATGGSAVIAKNMGEDEKEKANENFTLIIIMGAIIGVLCIIVAQSFMEGLLKTLGATKRIYGFAYDYLHTIMLFAPLLIFQVLFQTFFITSGRPKLGLKLMIFSGILNLTLDYVLIKYFNLGIKGAAIASLFGYSITVIFGFFCFIPNKNRSLYFAIPKLRPDVIKKTFTNGFSEMVTKISSGIITFTYNITMLKIIGEDGVAAISIIQYSQYLLTSIFLGFSSGIAPIFSYNYGSKDFDRIKKLFKICLKYIFILSIIAFLVAVFFKTPIISIFSKKGSEVFNIAKNGFFTFSFCYLFMGINIFSSSIFTAFSNGKVSAVISFLRAFVILIVCLKVLPKFFGLFGVWVAVPVAELLTLFVSIYFLKKMKKVYGY